MLANRSLTDFTSFFSPYDFKKSDDKILSYFKRARFLINWLLKKIIHNLHI